MFHISWKNFKSQPIYWPFFSSTFLVCSHKFRFGSLAILRKCNDPQSRTWFTSQTLLGCWHLAGSITKPKWVYNIPYSFLLWNNWKFGWLIWMSCWFLNEFLGPPLLFKAGQGWQIGERTKKNGQKINWLTKSTACKMRGHLWLLKIESFFTDDFKITYKWLLSCSA